MTNQTPLPSSELLSLAQQGTIQNVNLSQGHYENICLSQVHFENVTAHGTVFKNVNLRDTAWFNCDLTQAHFDLSKTQLEKTIFTAVNLTGAKLPQQLSALHLIRCNLSQIQIPPQSHWYQVQCTECNLSHTNFNAAQLEQVAFELSTLLQANLHQVNAPYLSLWQSNAAEATFSHANLTGAIFEKANLTATDFTGACLEKAYLHQALAKHAIFTDAKLNYANASYLQAHFGDFANAELNQCNFHCSEFEGAFLPPYAAAQAQPENRLLKQAEQWTPRR